jgi:hypothetical protein
MFTKNEQILLIIILFITICFAWKINNLKKKNTETFVDTTIDPVVSSAIQKVYAADIDAVNKLSNFATQLSNGGAITVPNGASFTGPVSTGALTPASITTTGTVRCNEIICNKISPFNNDGTLGSYITGAIAVIYAVPSATGYRVPIYTTISHYWFNGMDKKSIFYIVMPGYKLEVYNSYNFNGTKTLIDNTTGKSPIRSNDFIYTAAIAATANTPKIEENTTTMSRSCKLFYGEKEVPEFIGGEK